MCQSTADDNDNDAQETDHGTNVWVHVHRDEALVLLRRPKAHSSLAMSAAAIKRSFSLKCRDIRRDLKHVKNDTAHGGCAKTPKKTQKSVMAKESANGSDHVLL